MKTHHYKTTIEWNGNEGTGTSSYSAYSRNHSIVAKGKYGAIQASSDPSFRGDPTRYNPEELFLSSLSSCHMLWYLHLCSVNNIVVVGYTDHAVGQMEETKDGSGKFTAVTLFPQVIIANPEHHHLAHTLHSKASEMCFIANSCNFEVKHTATIEVK